ncbi:FtsQ Cell division septal protein [Candidatus Nanopelagicaceae bacterium]
MLRVSRFSLVATVVVALFAGLTYLLAWSNIFTVSTISIEGAPTSSSKESISKVADLRTGDKLARVEPRAIAHRISDFDWVESAEISRNWISGEVVLTITPRTPTAYFNNRVLDASGKVFTLPGFTGAELPRVSASTPELGLVAINLFQNLPESIRADVLSLAAYNESNFSLKVDRGQKELQILWGANEENELKTEVIDALLALPENKNIRRIDVSAPHAPIVK